MRPLTIAAFSIALLAVAATQAQQPAPARAAAPAATTPVAAPAATKGDAKRGEQLVYTCKGCHGVTGYRNAYPNYHVPRVAGQNEAYLVAALTGYRDGTRKHPTMQAQAQSFNEQDIADIAAYLASQK